MKKIVAFLFLICALMSQTAVAQVVVAEENFDDNTLGWTENAKPDLGESIIMDGKFKFDSKTSSCFFDTKNEEPNLLSAECVMPIDPLQGFEISVDIEFDHVGTFSINGLALNDINCTSGILLEYDDDFNFIAVAVSEKYSYILIYKEGQLVRYKIASVKMKGVDKKRVVANLKVVYKDYSLKVLIDDIEMSVLRKVNIESPAFALFTTAKRKVEFDNLIIAQ